ncbi:MAG: DMT family transporter [Ahrensia sp.]|nr:DMT family transporter [Ahrensia sp.]
MLANALLLLAGLIWGGGFVAQQTAMDDIGPFLFMACRFGLAALAIIPLVIWETRTSQHHVSLRFRDIGPGMTVGFTFFATMALQQLGILGTSVTNAGMLTGLYVVLTPLLAFVLMRDRIARLVWPCAMLAFGGIWLLGGGGLTRLTWGDWLVAVSAVFAALHVIAMGRAVKGLRRPALVACVQFVVSASLAFICFGAARLWGTDFEPAINAQLLLAAGPEILYASLLAGALAFTIMAFCQQYTSASIAAVLMSSEALFAALGGALFLSERLELLGYVGCAMLLTAIAVTSFATEAGDTR